MADYTDYGLGPWPPTGGTEPDVDAQVDGAYPEQTIPPDYEPTVPDWSSGWYAWDTVTLGNQNMPGIATVKIRASRKLDIKSAPGSSGATLTDQGYDPATVDITLRMWTREHLGMFEATMRFISPKLSSTSVAWDIVHPATTIHGISSVYIKEISGPEAKGDGTWEVHLSCIEWFPSPKKNVTKTPSTSKAADNSQDDDLTKMLEELDKPSDTDSGP